MPAAPIPENDKDRLAALLDYSILDTTPSTNFDDLTKLAASLFQAPVAIVSLVDSSRQWFKSCLGLDAKGDTARAGLLCIHYPSGGALRCRRRIAA